MPLSHRTAAVALDHTTLKVDPSDSAARRKARVKPCETVDSRPTKINEGLLALAKREKTMALQTALLEHGAEPSMILVILALMGATGTVRIRRSRPEGFANGTLAPEVQAVFRKYHQRFEGCLDNEMPVEAGLRLRYWEDACQVKAFEILCGFQPHEMHELFAAFVASSLKTCSGFNAALGDSPLAAALAQEVNADVTRHWRLDDDYVKRCRKAELVEIALAIGVAEVCSPPLTAERLRKLKSVELRKILMEFVAVRPDAGRLVPKALRFGKGT